jgi:hypothetical protein
VQFFLISDKHLIGESEMGELNYFVTLYGSDSLKAFSHAKFLLENAMFSNANVISVETIYNFIHFGGRIIFLYQDAETENDQIQNEDLIGMASVCPVNINSLMYRTITSARWEIVKPEYKLSLLLQGRDAASVFIIEDVIVNTAFKGRGHGKLLMKKLEEVCHIRPALFLLNTSKEGFQRFYQDLDYQIIATGIKEKESETLTRYFMAKYLL